MTETQRLIKYLANKYEVPDKQDFIQEMNLKLLKANINFNTDEHKRRWLYRVGRNKAIDIWRKQQNRRTDELTIVADTKTESYDEIFKVLKNIPNIDLIRSYYDGWKIRELAEREGVNENAIKARMFKARKAIKDNFDVRKMIIG